MPYNDIQGDPTPDYMFCLQWSSYTLKGGVTVKIELFSVISLMPIEVMRGSDDTL